MRRRALRPLLVSLALLLCAGSAQAQTSAGVTSAVGRARGLMDAGDGATARALLDSLVAHTDPSSDDMAEALYWRAVLSDRVVDGERDWKRLVVDVPLSPRVPEALLRLGELEILRGRPAMARAHYERVLRDFSESPQRAKAMIQIVRSYFEERDLLHACESVSALRTVTIPEGELQLQAKDLQQRCVSAAPAPAAPTAAASPTAAAPTAAAPTAAAPTAAAPTAGAAPTAAVPTPPTTPASTSAVFSVQLAAYDTRAQATALVKRLATRGVKARVDGERQPFRVRVGRFATRAEAVAMLTRLKKQGQRGFVAELGR